jgi:hypothetical protein
MCGGRIQAQMIKFPHLAVGQIVVVLQTTQGGLNAGHQLARAEWLDEVIIGPHGQPHQLICFFIFGGKQNDVDIFAAEFAGERFAAQLGQQFQAIHAGQHNVQHDWLARLVKPGTSWVAPQDIQRVTATNTDSEVAVEQVKRLDKQNDRLKAIVADCLYGNHYFLAVFLVVTTVVALVRLRSNLRLYENPIPKPPKSKGRPQVHGPVFKLTAPARSADRTEKVTLAGQKVRLSAWHGLHLRKLLALVGMVLRVEFLKADDTPRYKTPLCLFWTGPGTVPLVDLCRMYLWRFAIKRAFRFLKQRLGLNAAQSGNPQAVSHWMWLVALAYCQLLLMEPLVADHRPAWYPQATANEAWSLSPGLVQRGALAFLVGFGTPAAPPRPAGKGKGRAKGYRPQPKKRYPVVRKSPKRPLNRLFWATVSFVKVLTVRFAR